MTKFLNKRSRTSEGTEKRNALEKLWAILPRRERREALGITVLMIGVGLLETLGVGTILPFISVAADPGVLNRPGMINTLYGWSGASSERAFLILSGGVVLTVLVVGNALRAVSVWWTHRFSQLAGHALATRLIASYLARSYEYFLTRHSADLGKNILQEVYQVVNGVVFLSMSGFSRLITALLLVTLLFIADPVLTLSALGLLGGAYGVIYVLTRGLQTRLGKNRVDADRGRYYSVSETFAGIKDVKLKGLENVLTERFSAQSLAYARSLSLSMTLSQTPRFLLEAVAFGGVLLIVLYLLIARGGMVEALPLISLYAFAGYRLLPAIQEIFNAATRIRYSLPALDLVHREIAGAPAPVVPAPAAAPLSFTRAIRLENVDYRYPLGERPVVADLSLEIPHGALVGFIGPTGSGKSTTVDLILGLLRPVSGRVIIDDTPLTDEETIRRWQARIGYVPQHIFLADDTIAANIAFGEQAPKTDYAKIERAARMAQLHDFIANELPEGYDTQIGERGVRLSGGQRQRLGLARALYGDPAVLVLDEATSALDSETETLVIKALDAVDRDVTIIAIAHRLSTIRHSDLIFRMEDGRLAASGSAVDMLAARG